VVHGDDRVAGSKLSAVICEAGEMLCVGKDFIETDLESAKIDLL
jgi:hypothetical protein